ncbi:MAG: TIM44-like domain-containing protein, partial [Pseudomonadota bacterium]|nr:TIM44-like domain-containing protein [Pseudomonadota bacterium]
GKQREAIGQQAAPRAPAQAPTAAAAPAAGSRWLGPLAGLAAGGLLAALFFGGAFDGIRFLDIAMIMLLIGAAVFVVRMLRQKSAANNNDATRFSGMKPAPISGTRDSAGSGPGSYAPPREPYTGSSARAPRPVSESAVTESVSYPPGFEPAPFLRSAKTSFIRLQAANDARDLNDIRDYTTPEMYAELAMEMQERGDVAQKTEVIQLDANMLDVVTEGELAIASVRFSGLIRETENGPTEPFDEVWHVQKSLRDRKSVWLIAGIQQMPEAGTTGEPRA